MAYLSIVIPAYNEGQRIAKTLSRIYDFLKTKKYDYKVIVVDDGSSDDTVLKARESLLGKEGMLEVVSNGVNIGKGRAVKNGILNSDGEYLLFSDADLSTPIEEVDKLFTHIEKGADAVIGSRSAAGSKVVVHQSWYRELMGKTFNMFVKLLLIRDFNDTQCGFKLFKGKVVRDIAGLMRIDGFAFDVEMLYIARSKGYKIKEAGISWENSTESKVKFFHSPASMFIDLFRIKTLHKSYKTRR